MISINKILNAPDSRYSLETDNNGTFNLQIDDLRRADEGIYECQVNTDPQLAWSVTLQIVGKINHFVFWCHDGLVKSIEFKLL